MPITIDGTGTITGATTLASTVASPTFTTPALGTPASGALTNCTLLPAGQLSGTVAVARLPAGSVLQVVPAIKTDAQSTTSTSPVDITGLSISITPSSASSKILVMARINLLSMSDSNAIMIRLLRDSTVITSNSSGGLADTNDAWVSGGGGGTSVDSRKISSGAVDVLDSPATGLAINYKMQMLATGGTGTVNSWSANNDVASVSSITLMEIAA